MEFNIKLENMELIKESFEKIGAPFKRVGIKVNTNMNNSFKLGTVSNLKDISDKKIALEYKFNIIQKDVESDEKVTELFIQYIAIFNDEDNKIIKLMEENKLLEKDVNELIINLNKLAYPYIKEYIELKYNKANITLKLPLELSI
ncbi:hypothetical protein [Clostridium thermobutyricum]|uniref:hypothetical protein n=1 Tax=Clostridium thermobutyricum TaxID=29372 RepID=UPI0018AB1873|nr:hypothetical protein [Clostridium thermobutyricum]